VPWPRPNPGVAPLALPCRCPAVALPGTTDPDSIGKWTTTTLPTIDNNHQPTTNEPTTNHHGPIDSTKPQSLYPIAPDPNGNDQHQLLNVLIFLCL